MLQYAFACFAVTLLASLLGFGRMVDAHTEITRGLAVVSLVLFCVTFCRLLYDNDPSPSRNAAAPAPGAGQNP
jgi:uncharacterized membrane protein YtjA (UPF0391 family)